MLNRGIRLLLVLVLGCCTNEKSSKSEDLLRKSADQVTQNKYLEIYSAANDSLSLWVLNHLSSYNFPKGQFEYELDSLLCFNQNGDRFVGCLLEQVLVNGSNSDGLIYFLGEKINSKWYFFRDGSSIVVPREMVKGHDLHRPLSYEQLHEIALKQIYGGYLLKNGEINERWFLNHFEGNGWGDFSHQRGSDYFIKGKRFTDRRAFFECIHLESVRNNWRNKDTTQPVKHFPEHP